MILSNFDPSPCPRLTEIVEELIRTRKIKEMMNNAQRPMQLSTNSSQPNSVPKHFTIEKQFSLRNDIRKKILKRNSPARMVSKYKQQAKFNIFLLNYLHKTSHLEAIRNTPIYPSALDTKEDPCYPFNYQEEAYKKDYPHYSNVIQLPRIPVQTVQPIFLVPRKLSTEFPDPYVNTCVTLSQAIRFCNRFLQNQDMNFEKIAVILNLSERNVKFMYETLNVQLQLDHLSDKLARFRNREKMLVAYQRYCAKIMELIHQAFQSKDCSQFIPRGEIKISLKDLHQALNMMQISIL